MKKIILFIIVVLCAGKVNAQWQPANGPMGIGTLCFTSSGNNVFAGTPQGVYVTTNKGKTWASASTGLPTAAGYSIVGALLTNGSDIFAGTGEYGGNGDEAGIYLSPNNGQNWYSVDNGISTAGGVTSLAAVGTTLFAGTSTLNTTNGGGGALYRSTNNGTSWTSVESGNVSSIVVDGNDNIYAAMYYYYYGQNYGTIFESSDTGKTWTIIYQSQTYNLPVYALGFFQGDLYAGISIVGGIGEIGRYNGTTWDYISGLPSAYFSFAANSTDLFDVDGVILESTNGVSWTSIDNGLLNPSATALYVFQDSILFAGTGNGIYYSDDNGNYWNQVNDYLSNTQVNALASIGDTALMAGTPQGCFINSYYNSNNLWTINNNGFPNGNTENAICVDGSTIYAATSGSGVYLSVDGGNQWLPANTDITTTNVNCIVASGSNLFIGTSAGVYISTNNGDSWSLVNTGLPVNSDVTSLAVSGSSIFAGTLANGVYVTTNNGGNWTSYNNGLSNYNVLSLAVKGNNLFAGISYDGVYVSSVSNNSWSHINTGMRAYSEIYSFAFDNNYIFAAGDSDNVYLSADTGKLWISVNSGLPGNIAISSILALTIHDSTLYAGIESLGVWYDSIPQLLKLAIVSASATPASYCPGGSTTLTATGGGSAYTWSPSTALSATTGSSITADPTVTTTYTVTGAGGSETATVVVVVNPSPTITASPKPATYCGNGSSTLTASGGITYTWSPSTDLSATTGSSVTANPTVSTTYTVTGTNSNGCSATNTVTVTVTPGPTITVSPYPASYCPGGSSILTASGGDTYTWSPSTSLNATTGGTVAANPLVTTTYTVTGSNSNGCSATNTVVVTVYPSPTITATPNPASYCPGGSSTLTASGGISYTWSPSTGLSATIGSVVATDVSASTTYTVTGTDANGCVNTGTVSIIVGEDITASALPASYCANGSATLSASGGVTYTWSPSTGLSATTGATVTASPTVTTTYTVDGSNGAGCNGTTTVILTVNPAPSIAATPNPPSYCPGGISTLTASGGNTYTWSPSTGLSATTGEIVAADPAVTTTYVVIGTTSNGCSGATTVVVTVDPLPTISISSIGDVLTASGATTYIWNTGSTHDTTIVNKTGRYTVTGTDADGCSDTASYYITISGIPEISVNNDLLSIFPNPTTGEINIVSTKPIDVVKVTDLLGQLIYEAQPKQTKFSFELKEEGMYFVTVNTANRVSTSKVIVSK